MMTRDALITALVLGVLLTIGTVYNDSNPSKGTQQITVKCALDIPTTNDIPPLDIKELNGERK